MEIANYNSMKDALSGSIKDQNPQLYDEVNDKAVYAKGLVETTGNLMTTGAVVGSIKKLKGSASIMEKLGLSQEDLEGMAEDINNGNGQDVLAGLSKRIINKGTNKLQGAFNKLLGRSTDPDAPEPPTEPSAPVTGSQPPSDLDLISNEEAQTLFNPEVNVAAQEATTANESIVGSVGVASRQESIDQASAAATRAATLGSDPSSVAANVVKSNVVNSTEEEVAEGGAKVMSKAVKAEDVLKGLTEGSEVADETGPIGLAVTAALGVASLVGGLLIHTHHNAYSTPNVIGVKSYAVNQGIDY